MTDHITILKHSRSRLAKLWQADGTIAGYDETKNYTVKTEQVDSLRALSALLTRLEADSNSAVIRGKFKGEQAAAELDAEHHKPGLARKIKALYDDVPLHWVLMDIDKYATSLDPVKQTEAAINEFITTQLPACFHDVSYHWQLSGSAGHVNRAGVLSAHVWFWMADAATSDELKQWAKLTGVSVDHHLFNSVQFHYTAAPLAEPGVTIPVKQRSGFVEGLFGDEVTLVIPRVQQFPVSTVQSYGDDDLLSLASRQGWTLEHGREVLFALNPDADRETWINDLAAFHHEFYGDPAALEIAIEWSQQASNFGGREDVEKRWESFGRYTGKPMTGAWLLKRRGECQALLKYDAKGEWANALKVAQDEFTIREKLCPQILKDDRLDEMARESLAQCLFEAFKRLGTKYPIAQCRKLIADRRAHHRRNDDSDLPDWAKGWVYVTDMDQFFRMDSEEWLSMQGFNARFNRELATDEEGHIPKSAAWVALEDLQLPHVTKAVYLPWAGATFELYGTKCVNRYRPSTVPTEVTRLSPLGVKAVNVVKRHIDLISGGRPEVAATMIDWLAHNVQQPGVKIRWAPLIKGIEGDGKSLLGSLLAAVMGHVNVKQISPKVLGTDFTGWASGSCVAVLEEIKLTGHNRHDILNALKPYITNSTVPVHSKGKDELDFINTTNYIAFTNFSDALPITDTDRRWWIIFTQFANGAELTAAVAAWAPSLTAYFDELHDAIQQHPAELRKWLLDHELSPGFRPNGTAPMTEEKAVMIAMSSSDEEDALREILGSSTPIKGITPTVFSSRCMGDAMMQISLDISINTTTRNRLFSKAGFVKLPKKVKWDGDAHTVWVKGASNLEPNEVRKILDKTIPESAGAGCDDLF